MLKFLVLFGLVTSILGYNSSNFIEVNEYYFSIVQASYYQAYAICKRNGWTLASPRDSNEEDQLNLALKDIGITYSFWLGGFYVKDQHFFPSWIWLDNGDQLGYSNWGASQPNIINSSIDYCLAQYGVGSDFPSPAKWLSNPCSYNVFFVCQRHFP